MNSILNYLPFKNRQLFPWLGSRGGFSLIEVLVAILILSIGLLGLAGLQTKALTGTQSALFRSRAVQRCEDILDRMRANRGPALDGNYNIDTEDPGSSTGIVAMDDLVEWKTALAATLPEGDGSAAVNCNIATVIVQWTEAADGPQQVSVVTRL
jgi:type IV pilus assembly protein PilV